MTSSQGHSAIINMVLWDDIVFVRVDVLLYYSSIYSLILGEKLWIVQLEEGLVRTYMGILECRTVIVLLGQAVCLIDSKLKGQEFIGRQDKEISYKILDKSNDVLLVWYGNLHIGNYLT